MSGDDIRTRNDALRNEVDGLLAGLDRQRRELADAQARLAESRVTVWSPDNLVKVVAGPDGVPAEVALDPAAFKRATPETLSRSITAAVQEAARAASAAAEQAMAPLLASAGDLPDLPDLVPGAPSIRELLSAASGTPDSGAPDAATPPDEPPRRLTEEEEDEYFRNRSYLR